MIFYCEQCDASFEDREEILEHMAEHFIREVIEVEMPMEDSFVAGESQCLH